MDGEQLKYHKQFRFGQDLLLTAGPALRPDVAAQDLGVLGLENLQRWSLHSLSGQFVPLLGCSQSQEVFPPI